MAETSFIIEEVRELLDPILEEMGFELVDVEYLTERGRWVLRVYLDKEGGITLDDCAEVSRELGALIDVKDFIPHQYVLEVSSPGLNRPLRKEKDFAGAVGKKIKVKTVVPINGRQNFTGYLQDFQEGKLYLEIDEGLVPISTHDVKRANLVYEFEA